jgi:hypothetical protein
MGNKRTMKDFGNTTATDKEKGVTSESQPLEMIW